MNDSFFPLSFWERTNKIQLSYNIILSRHGKAFRKNHTNQLFQNFWKFSTCFILGNFVLIENFVKMFIHQLKSFKDQKYCSLIPRYVQVARKLIDSMEFYFN